MKKQQKLLIFCKTMKKNDKNIFTFFKTFFYFENSKVIQDKTVNYKSARQDKTENCKLAR